MVFSDFSIIHSIFSLLYMCFGLVFTLGIIIISYRIPYSILQWIMYEEEKNNLKIKKSFDYQDEQEEDDLLLYKLFKKDK